jgi:hypothetical protein
VSSVIHPLAAGAGEMLAQEHNTHVRVTKDRLGAHANCCNKITSEAHKKANALKLAKTCSVRSASGPSKISRRLSRRVCGVVCCRNEVEMGVR